MINRQVCTYDELLKSLEDILQKRFDSVREGNQRRMADNQLPDAPGLLTDVEKIALKEVYDRSIESLGWYTKPDQESDEAQNLSVYFGVFCEGGGYQLIANGSVSDLNRPVENSYNFHFQNTSQWLYAFGLVFDTERREFSRHT